MAKLGKRQMIAVSPDVYEEIYTLKGPGTSFGDFIRHMLDTIYPQEKDDTNQTTLAPICPECGEDLDCGVCPGCGYPYED